MRPVARRPVASQSEQGLIMATRKANKLSSLISSLHKKLPGALHQPAQTLAFNSQVLLGSCFLLHSCGRRTPLSVYSWNLAPLSQVKYAGFSGIWIEKLSENEVVMTLKNRFRCVRARTRMHVSGFPA